MRNHRRSLHQRRPFVDPLEGRELLSRLFLTADAPYPLPAAAEYEREVVRPAISPVVQPVSDRTDPDVSRDVRETKVAIAALAPTSAAPSSPAPDEPEPEPAGSSPDVADERQAGVAMGTTLEASRVGADQAVEEGPNAAPATPAAAQPSVGGNRPPVAWSSVALRFPVQPALPTVEIPRGASGPALARADESPAGGGARGGGAAVAMPETPEGDPGEGPPPRGDGPIAGVLPFDRSALDRAVDRFLAPFEDLDVRQPATLIRVSSGLAVLAAAVALEVARRWYRSRNGNGNGASARGRGSPLATGLPGWPGSWPASPR